MMGERSLCYCVGPAFEYEPRLVFWARNDQSNISVYKWRRGVNGVKHAAHISDR